MCPGGGGRQVTAGRTWPSRAWSHLPPCSPCRSCGGAAVLTAAYGLGAYGSRTLRLASRGLVAAAVVAAIITLQAIDGNHATPIACALFATALAVGEITAAHRDLVTSQARQAYDEQLASLAREVHDVVAHQLSAIAVQAGAARVAAAVGPSGSPGGAARLGSGRRHSSGRRPATPAAPAG